MTRKQHLIVGLVLVIGASLVEFVPTGYVGFSDWGCAMEEQLFAYGTQSLAIAHQVGVIIAFLCGLALLSFMPKKKAV